MKQLFITAFGLGLALSAAPGALNMETIRRGINGGFWPAIQVHIGALAGDGIWMLIALLGITLSVQESYLSPLFMVLGGLLLLWNAWQVAQTQWLQPTGPVLPQHRRHGLLIGAVLALSSPLTAAFWVSLENMFTSTLGSFAQTRDLMVLCGAYVLSVLTWGAMLSALAVWGQRLIHPEIWRWWHAGSSLLLGVWGIQMLWTAWTRLVD